MDFKDKIRGYRPEVDRDAWQSMERLLDQQLVIEQKENNRTTLLEWLRRFMILGMVFLLIAYIGTQFWGKKNESNSMSSISMHKVAEDIETNTTQEENLASQDLNRVDKSTIRSEGKKGLDSEYNNPHKLAKDNSNEKVGGMLSDAENNQKRSIHAVDRNQLTSHTNEKEREIKSASLTSDERQRSEKRNAKGTMARNEETNGADIEGGRKTDHIETTNSTRDVIEAQHKGLSLDQNSSSISEGVESTNSSLATEKVSLLEERESRGMLTIDKLLSNKKSNPESTESKSLGAPDFIYPKRSPSRFLIGIDVGNGSYFNNVSGESFSFLGVYEIFPWLRTGIKLNRTNMKEGTQYMLSPEIRRRKIERSTILYAQIVPVRLWRFNLGIEGGYGWTWTNEIYRRLENPQPNVLIPYEDRVDYYTHWFHAGVFLTVDLSNSWKIGATINTDIGTESLHYAGRLMFRF